MIDKHAIILQKKKIKKKIKKNLFGNDKQKIKQDQEQQTQINFYK